MADFIRVENLTFEYVKSEDGTRVKALENVSLNVEKGSFAAVIGQNGSGKSTLAKNINGLLVPSEGKVCVDGMDTSLKENLWEVRKKVAMVFQNPDNQIVSSVVEDDVAFGPENLGVEPLEIRRRVDEALKAVEMYDHRKKAPHLLSGGQKQRVAIAGAVAMEPECIVFDEPTAMLDPRGRREVMSIIKKLNQKGITTVLITHFMEEAAEADRITVLDQGRKKLEGTPREIFQSAGRLLEIGLDVPPAVRLSMLLKERDIKIPAEILTEREIVDFLKSLREGQCQ